MFVKEKLLFCGKNNHFWKIQVKFGQKPGGRPGRWDLRLRPWLAYQGGNEPDACILFSNNHQLIFLLEVSAKYKNAAQDFR